jgi:hypothetical protein
MVKINDFPGEEKKSIMQFINQQGRRKNEQTGI